MTSATGGSIAQTEDFANVGSLALDDLNLDGNLDVVWYAEHGSDNNDFQVFYGNGNGTLTTPQQYDLNTGGDSGHSGGLQPFRPDADRGRRLQWRRPARPRHDLLREWEIWNSVVVSELQRWVLRGRPE